MPDMPPTAASASPAPPGGGSAQQPPFGSSPATGPTPNKGFEAAAAQRLGVIVKQLETLIPMLGSSSDIGSAVMKALSSLAKFVPAGSVTPAAENNSLKEAQMRNTQNNQQMQALMQQRQQAQQGAGGGGMAAAA